MTRSGGAYLTVKEVMAAFRVGDEAVYRLIKSGELEAIRAAKQFRITERSVRDRLGDPAETYVTSEEVASALGVHRNTVMMMIRRKDLEAVVFPSAFRIPERSLKAYIARAQVR